MIVVTFHDVIEGRAAVVHRIDTTDRIDAIAQAGRQTADWEVFSEAHYVAARDTFRVRFLRRGATDYTLWIITTADTEEQDDGDRAVSG